MKYSSKSRNQLRLPTFIGVGSIRTATTWLHEQLKSHIGLPFAKESHFFNFYYNRGLGWYASLFRGARTDRPVGEFCPTYFHGTTTRDRICRDLPGCKIIVTLRHPVERAYSQYKMLRHDGHLPNVSFAEALKINPGIVSQSRYATHLLKWWEAAGRENVLVCLYDDLLSHEQSYLDRICDFIDVPPVPVVALDKKTVAAFEAGPKSDFLVHLSVVIRNTLQSHQYFRTHAFLDRMGFFAFCGGRGEKFPPIPFDVAESLREELLPEIEMLERLLVRDLSSWKAL